MTFSTQASRQAGRARTAVVLVVALGALLTMAAAPVVLAKDSSAVAAAKAATVRFHSLEQARKAGYGVFYICTDNEALDAAMGQHYADPTRIDDQILDVTNPEVLVYEPKINGYDLVAVEYVQLAASWDANHASPPQLFGRTLAKIPAGNRYGLPEFYEIHAWLYRSNPRGMFDDWNPNVSCKGNGDPA